MRLVGAEPGEEARDVASVVLELAEAVTQVGFFGADDGKIDGEEQNDHDGRNPETARGDGESERDDERSEIKRIARVGVRAGGGELLVLVDVSGGERADENAGSGEDQAGDDRASRSDARDRSRRWRRGIRAERGCGGRCGPIRWGWWEQAAG